MSAGPQAERALAHPTVKAMARALSIGHQARTLIPVEQTGEAFGGYFTGADLLRATLTSGDGYTVVVNLYSSGRGLPSLAPSHSSVPGIALYYPAGGKFVPAYTSVRIPATSRSSGGVVYRQNPAEIGPRLAKARAVDAGLAAAEAAIAAGTPRPRFLWDHGGGQQVIRPGDRISIPYDTEDHPPTVGRVARVKAIRMGKAGLLSVDVVTDDGVHVPRALVGHAENPAP